MKPKLNIIHSGFVFCLALGACVFFKPCRVMADADESAATGSGSTLVTVQTGNLKYVTLHRYITGYGMIEAAPATADQPAAGAQLAAPGPGVVARVSVAAGQHVEKGETLVELNSGTATFASARAEFERQKNLFAQQNTSEKNLQSAAAQLDSLRIMAPLSGTVTRLNVKSGEAVDTTMVVAEVMDLNRLAVAVKIPAAQAGGLKTGETVRILGQPPVSATLSFVSPVVDAADGAVSVWAALPADCGMRPGEFVRLEIATATKTNCLAAPAESVVTGEDGNSVISLVNGNEATQTPVQTGLREEGWVEIAAPGLKPGDTVVTIGAYGLPEKTKIQIVNPAGDTAVTNSTEAQ